MNTKISCPKCHFEFDVDEVLAENAARDLEAKIRQEMETKQAKILQERQSKWEQKWQAQKKQLEDELTAQRKKYETTIKQELQTQYQTKQFELAEKLKNADVMLKSRDEQLEKMRAENLDYLKQKEIWEQEKQNLALENQKKLNEAREKIQEEISLKLEEAQKLKLAEKDKKIADFETKVAELQRKLDQGSQQSQGEVLELALEEQLRDNFSDDLIEPIGKGVNGADVRQRVFNTNGAECGKIIWECKRTKNWTEGWIGKLKADQREEKADLAVLTTTTMPKNVDKKFQFYQGIWVCVPELALMIATTLRFHLIRQNHLLDSQKSKDEKVEKLYRYLTGPEFSQKIESQYEAIMAMQQELEKEKTFWMRHFAARQKQIEALQTSVAGMYGGLQGVTQGALPSVKLLEGE